MLPKLCQSRARGHLGSLSADFFLTLFFNFSTIIESFEKNNKTKQRRLDRPRRGVSYFRMDGQFGFKMEEKKICFEEKEAFKTLQIDLARPMH